VDLKQRRPSLVGPVLELLARYDADRRVTLASFHTSVIREVRARGFCGQTVLSRDEVLALIALPEPLFRRLSSMGERVQVPLRAGPIELASRAFIDKCHRLGLAVDYWTVNDPIEAEVLLHRGADGIMTDDPARLRPVFDRWRQRAAGG
jgi:glycerophosphoryl diester phosphodiesterase